MRYQMILSLMVLILLAGCAADDPAPTDTPTPKPPLATFTPDPAMTGYRVETVIERAEFPVTLVFTPDDYLLWTEDQLGRVQMVNMNDPAKTQTTVYQIEFGGQDWNAPINVLTGIALDPDFTNNRHVWIYYVEPEWVDPQFEHAVLKVIRFRLEGVAVDPVVMWQHPLASADLEHREGNLHFDAAGYLYLGTGDGGEPHLTQRFDTVEGKIHRFAVTEAGLVPADGNPLEGNSMWAYGLRNPFDFTFDPLSGDLYATVNGPDCDDKLTRIVPFGNYAWREDYPCDAANPQFPDQYIYPLYTINPTEGITGITFYDRGLFPEWYGDVFFCAWNFGIIRRGELNPDRDQILRVQKLDIGDFTCSTDIVVGNDGALYFTSLSSIQRLVPDL